jgi:hypothetical protein
MRSLSRSRPGTRALWIAAVLGVMSQTWPVAPLAAQSPFQSLSGSWAGAGQVRFSSGNTEALRCRAYYTPKDSGTSVGLSIRCASQSNKIELRANLNYQSGKVTGSWEERT